MNHVAHILFKIILIMSRALTNIYVILQISTHNISGTMGHTEAKFCFSVIYVRENICTKFHENRRGSGPTACWFYIFQAILFKLSIKNMHLHEIPCPIYEISRNEISKIGTKL